MRIGIYDPYLDSLSGGEKYMLTAASCLSQNHQVYVLWDNPHILQYAQEKFALDLTKVNLAENIFATEKSFIKRLRETKQYDALFYLSDGSIPFVTTQKFYIHFQFPVEWVAGRSFKNRIKLKKADTIICNSYFTKHYIDKTFHMNSTVVYPPASGEVGIIKTVKQNIILTVGRFAKLDKERTFKKQEVMIKTFKQMIDDGLKNWEFILVVSSKKEESLQTEFLTELIGYYPIKIILNATSDQLTQLYAASKIYWHAAGYGEDLTARPDLAEHFGIATVQAMEQGSVPVVINAGGQKEIIDDGKNGFLWNTLEECRQKTEYLMEHESVLQKCSQQAQLKAEEFSLDSFCNSISAIIK